eukprot:Lithocolla_globosa_v1_NODE_1240_length_2746_cov_9.606466.p1 type:complete len:528 gc:universal NODE_1240_length_2746_cov_9.606466:1635-52(-)
MRFSWDHIINLMSKGFVDLLILFMVKWGRKDLLTKSGGLISVYVVVHFVRRLSNMPFRRAFKAFVEQLGMKPISLKKVELCRFSSVCILCLLFHKYFSAFFLFLVKCYPVLTEIDRNALACLTHPDILAQIKFLALMARCVLLPRMKDAHEVTSQEEHETFISQWDNFALAIASKPSLVCNRSLLEREGTQHDQLVKEAVKTLASKEDRRMRGEAASQLLCGESINVTVVGSSTQAVKDQIIEKKICELTDTPVFNPGDNDEETLIGKDEEKTEEFEEVNEALMQAVGIQHSHADPTIADDYFDLANLPIDAPSTEPEVCPGFKERGSIMLSELFKLVLRVSRKHTTKDLSVLSKVGIVTRDVEGEFGFVNYLMQSNVNFRSILMRDFLGLRGMSLKQLVQLVFEYSWVVSYKEASDEVKKHPVAKETNKIYLQTLEERISKCTDEKTDIALKKKFLITFLQQEGIEFKRQQVTKAHLCKFLAQKGLIYDEKKSKLEELQKKVTAFLKEKLVQQDLLDGDFCKLIDP